MENTIDWTKYDQAPEEEKVSLLKSWAEQGDSDAQFELGVCYQDGDGVKQDYSESAHWFRLAAKQGDPTAQFSIGHMYASGIGCRKDDTKAIRWLRKAAKQGVSDAYRKLGCILLTKKEGSSPQDIEEALKWFRVGAENGDIETQLTLGINLLSGSKVPCDYSEAEHWLKLAADLRKPGHKVFFISVVFALVKYLAAKILCEVIGRVDND